MRFPLNRVYSVYIHFFQVLMHDKYILLYLLFVFIAKQIKTRAETN